jgi:oligoribonuclease
MLIWLDLETTGLDPREDSILEIFAIATEDDLTEIPGSFHCITNEAWRRSWDSLHPAVRAMHLENGMWMDSLRSSISIEQAAEAFHDWILNVTKPERARVAPLTFTPNLAGSSVHFDAEFLRRWCPDAHGRFSHRHLDVSAINETARRFWPKLYETRPRNAAKAHRGEADIRESMGMLRHYLAHLSQLAPPAEPGLYNGMVAELVGVPVEVP